MGRPDRSLLSRRAFKAVEYLLAIVTVALLAGLLISPISTSCGSYAQAPKLTRWQFNRFKSVIDRFHEDCGQYPKSLDDLYSSPSDAAIAEKWHGPYMKDLPIELGYRFPGVHNPQGYDLWSFGPDQQDGTEDDIVNW